MAGVCDQPSVYSSATQTSLLDLFTLPPYQMLHLPPSQTIWFVDDTNVYRVTIHKTFEGNLTT